eukprot:1192341-Prorocentrum_minimum.AAC.2
MDSGRRVVDSGSRGVVLLTEQLLKVVSKDVLRERIRLLHALRLPLRPPEPQSQHITSQHSTSHHIESQHSTSQHSTAHHNTSH